MTLRNQAIQVVPFVVLTGQDDAIGEAARQTNRFIGHLEDELFEQNSKYGYILLLPKLSTLENYFVTDEYKAGVQYVTILGKIRKGEETLGLLIFTDKTEIQLKSIYKLYIKI